MGLFSQVQANIDARPLALKYIPGAAQTDQTFPGAPTKVTIEGLPTVANATTSTAGKVKQAAAQANSTATDVAGLVADFNALLAKLRTAGILAP